MGKNNSGPGFVRPMQGDQRQSVISGADVRMSNLSGSGMESPGSGGRAKKKNNVYP